MREVVTTVYFDGQFWIALIEKLDEDGTLFVGKHLFGAEPSNPEIVAFMLGDYGFVPSYPSDVRVRSRARKSMREQERSTNKAKSAFKESQKAYLTERKKENAACRDADKIRSYALRAEKRKAKKRGH